MWIHGVHAIVSATSLLIAPRDRRKITDVTRRLHSEPPQPKVDE
jgi:hypothetical protein